MFDVSLKIVIAELLLWFATVDADPFGFNWLTSIAVGINHLFFEELDFLRMLHSVWGASVRG